MLAKPWFGLCPPDLIAKVSLFAFKMPTMAATSSAVVGYNRHEGLRAPQRVDQ